MSHEISDKTKLTVLQVNADMATIDADLQTALRTLANGDKIISIDMIRNRTSNLVTAYISYEDQ
ncbi:MAG: hypothetical protein CMC15_14865 [Flavobacteriaceae bacterium]|nr:hypothetical protein [Flavobacteriaceae bacterium]